LLKKSEDLYRNTPRFAEDTKLKDKNKKVPPEAKETMPANL
jgi:hypothetical protein